MLSNLWQSLTRASLVGEASHWADQATTAPREEGGIEATLSLASHISEEQWEFAAKYIRAYAKASHWKVTSLKRQRGFIALHLEHSPPAQRPMIGPVQQKTAE